MLYEKAKDCFLEDFKSLVTINKQLLVIFIRSGY